MPIKKHAEQTKQTFYCSHNKYINASTVFQTQTGGLPNTLREMPRLAFQTQAAHTSTPDLTERICLSKPIRSGDTNSNNISQSTNSTVLLRPFCVIKVFFLSSFFVKIMILLLNTRNNCNKISTTTINSDFLLQNLIGYVDMVRTPDHCYSYSLCSKWLPAPL